MTWTRSEVTATPDRTMPNLWRAMALDAGAAAAARAAAVVFHDPAPLTPEQAELIGLVVSAVNGCGYGVTHHGRLLAELLRDETFARAVARDYREADLSARDRVLLDYAVALTCEPGERTRADVDRLREYGFDDARIVRAAVVAGCGAFLDRVACGLGVELEPGIEPWEFGEQR